jgi:uncharacterized protein (TIGR02145 family)
LHWRADTGQVLSGLTIGIIKGQIEYKRIDQGVMKTRSILSTLVLAAVVFLMQFLACSGDSDPSGIVKTAPIITTQPVSQTVASGESVAFSVLATGTAPLTYQWYKDGIAVSGEVSSTYTISSVTSNHAGAYTVAVSNSAGSVVSEGAVLTVNEATGVPVITSQPADRTVVAGDSASFTVAAAGSQLQYQWYHGTGIISGATSALYSIHVVAVSDSGTYSCAVSNQGGSVTSHAAIMTVLIPPGITAHPTGITVFKGLTATFSVTATGSEPLMYQWQCIGTDISGATSSSYTTPATTSSNNGDIYRCVVSNSAGSATSNDATLKVGAVADTDGNVYTSVIIGKQEWTVENLRTTKYNDGLPIPHVTDKATWGSLSTPAYCFYDNSTDPAQQEKWGALYNLYAVYTGKLAPPGWRVPTSADWTKLEQYMIANGFNYDGTTTGNKIAKALAAQTDWFPYTSTGVPGNDLGKNNSSGFYGLPAGSRSYDGSFASRGQSGWWWSTTAYSSIAAYFEILSYDIPGPGTPGCTQTYGLSVRMVRDIN